MDVARRHFLVGTGAAALGVTVVAQAELLVSNRTGRAYAVPLPGGTLDPLSVPKFVTPLLVPPVMPRRGTTWIPGLGTADRYEIAVRQLTEQILPAGMPATTVWGYGDPSSRATFNAPSLTIEARWRRPVRVRWLNQLVDGKGRYLPPILPVDQTLHWANPVGGSAGRDSHGADGAPYTGPVPITTHVHGAKTFEDSDGYPESWFLPPAVNLPTGYARSGTFYDRFRRSALRRGAIWTPGSAVFDYPNDQRAGTLWYHDHTLGMTRTNVYSGPAGFYLIRGGPDDVVQDSQGGRGRLPGPAPQPGERAGTAHYEIPIAIQDRSFGNDGSLFYPDSRQFFDGFAGPYLPDPASDISPIWNPEFFGNHMMVNGATWPFLQVERRRYRFRLLNGCNSRFLLLELSNGGTFWQIGTEGGFLPHPVPLQRLLMAPAERADVIVDFSGVPAGTEILLRNIAPDEPFGGGDPGDAFESADPDTTGQVMMFRVVPAVGSDPSTPPQRLLLPAVTGLGAAGLTRQVSLNEASSDLLDVDGNPQLPDAEPAGPRAALLGTVDPVTGGGVSLMWMDPVTESATVSVPEIWEIHNFTVDAHPIHLHATLFQVLDRAPMSPSALAAAPASTMAMKGHGPVRRTVAEAAAAGPAAAGVRGPESWETGFKDTVIAYPGEITRVLARFDRPGRFVWHCHIVEHEDNEMMRPFDVR